MFHVRNQTVGPFMVLALAWALGLALAPASIADEFVDELVQKCAAAQSKIESSTTPWVEDTWNVSGSVTGESDRWPEDIDPGNRPRVLVELIETDDFRGLSVSGVDAEGTHWSVWTDSKSPGCVLLEGSATRLENAEGGVSLSAEGPARRAFTRGDLHLDFELDATSLPEDQGDRAACAGCSRNTQCQSESCGMRCGGICGPCSAKAKGAACSSYGECQSCKCTANTCE